MRNAVSNTLKYGAAVVAGALLTMTVSVFGGAVPSLTTFQNGAVADADELNQNLAALKAAIDDNFARIQALEDLGDDTITTVIQSGAIPANGFFEIEDSCPSTHPVAVSCGVDSFSTSLEVSALSPLIDGSRPFLKQLGSYTTEPDGCRAVVNNTSNASLESALLLVTTCRELNPQRG